MDVDTLKQPVVDKNNHVSTFLSTLFRVWIGMLTKDRHMEERKLNLAYPTSEYATTVLAFASRLS
jgi:hypothetical protein